MSRSLNEWVGRTDDTPVPPRIRVRVFVSFSGICQECGVKISNKRWICDHTIALINGGENKESNLRPIHETCDKKKTASDVAIKSKDYRVRAKHIGVKLRKGRPLPGGRNSSLKKKLSGEVVRRSSD